LNIEDNYLVVSYPENMLDAGYLFYTVKALNGRVTEMDFTKYKNVTLELKGAKGGEQFALTMKDKFDPPDGTESKVELTATNTWATYEVPIAQFATADKKIIQTPLAFLFLGDKGLSIHVRSIQFN
jgi:hypothetical protein